MAVSRNERAKLLSLAVHEFRSPITVVSGYLRMLLTHHGASLGDEQRKLLQEAEKSCQRLAALVSEMAELASIESADRQAKLEPVDVFGLLSDVVASDMHHAADLGMALELSGARDSAAVLADRARIREAFAALLKSVLREQVEPVTIPVRCSIQPDAFGSRPAAVIVIGGEAGDDATVDPERWGEFEEWRGGLGFGLPFARAVIEQAGGRLWSPIRSGGRGAVRVTLPLEESAP